MFVLILMLLANTVCGTIWLVNFRKDNVDFLTTRYYVESVILLSIPIGIACFFVIAFGVVICLMYLEHRRMRRAQRLEDEGLYDFEHADEIAETYIRLLEKVVFCENKCKYHECVICLKEFEESELLYKIPHCQHIFHEGCLRKWFK